MKRILTIVGARPQIIKSAAISRTIKNLFSDEITEDILHTGQHYDERMSDIFFNELDIPAPKYNLGVGSAAHGVQTAHMIEGIERVLAEERYDGVLLFGDTNSTLAGAVASSKLRIPVFHVEAGLRSYNMSMPEEINRIVCDQLSSILFAPTQTAIDNLEKEGFFATNAIFANQQRRKVVLSGDIMLDNSIYFAGIAERESDITSILRLEKFQYILATIHRDGNTDSPERLNNIISAIIDIAEQDRTRVVLPLHPRTQRLLPLHLTSDNYSRVTRSNLVTITQPVSFFDMIELERNAKIIMTDSGGVQKEAYFFKRPSLILRPESEWMEIIENEAGIIVDADAAKIQAGYHSILQRAISFPPLFGDGRAAEKVVRHIIDA